MHYIYSLFKTRRLPLLELVALLISTSSAVANDDTRFRAPIAGIYEARIATIIQPAPQKLRLDVGASVDLVHIRLDSTRPTMILGVDFMTYTLLRSEHNLKFPVETVDYWFGIHAAYALTNDVAVRLRAAHISAHLVDGLADTTATFSEQRPFVYSREFIEVLASYTFHQFVRAYAGGTVLTSTQPRRANRLIPQAGIDVNIPIDADFSFRAGYDWRLIGIDDAYVTAQAAQMGIFWNTMGDGHGIMATVNGYNGRSMHGMFFDQADSYIGFGLQVLW